MTWLTLVSAPSRTFANTLRIDWVERGKAGLSKVVSYWSGPAEHKITYDTEAAALAAMDAWLAAVTPAPPIIDVGDTVVIRYPPNLRSVLGLQFTVTHVETVEESYWGLVETGSGDVLIIDSEVIFEKIA